MSLSSSAISLGPLRLSSTAAGVACCVVSMLGYSTTNACMNQLSRMSSVPTWAVFNKELVTVAVVGPWLLWQVWRRRAEFPRGRTLAILVAAGLSTELIGNIGVQWGYAIVGLAVMVPAYTGFLLVASTILGGVFLGERVSVRNLTAVGLLIMAVTLLGIGSGRARSSTKTIAAVAAGASSTQAGDRGTSSAAAETGGSLASPGPLAIAAAIGMSAAAGVVFSLLAIAIRHCVTGKTSYAAVMVVITGMGVLTLGPLSLFQAGAERLAATPWQQYALMFFAGVMNLIAFFALVQALKLTTVLHVNMITAGQVAAAAVIGVLFFAESCNRWLAAGVGLMIVGIVAFGSPVDREAVDAHV